MTSSSSLINKKYMIVAFSLIVTLTSTISKFCNSYILAIDGPR